MSLVVNSLVLKIIIKLNFEQAVIVWSMQVIDEEIYVLVIAIGKREKNIVYRKARKR